MSRSDLVSLKYDDARKWITRKHKNGKSWEEIASHPTSSPLGDFLSTREEEDGWPKMSPETWRELVKQQEEMEKSIIELDAHSGQALVIDGTSNNLVEIPESPNTCWQLYKGRLLAKGFAESTVGEIERATLKLLRRLSSDTRSRVRPPTWPPSWLWPPTGGGTCSSSFRAPSKTFGYKLKKGSTMI